MARNDQAAGQARRFRFERADAGDFPFYAPGGGNLPAWRWIVVLVGVLLGFATLTAPLPFFKSTPGGFLSAILFFAIPLAALALAARRDWTAIFRRLAPRDLWWIVGIALLNIVVSLAVALVARRVFDMNANPVGGMLGDFSPAERTLFYLRTIPQLFGEEVVSVLPFLAILWFCANKLRLTRTTSILFAWLSAAIIFGALHLPTYGWNLVQCFLVIGTARILLLVGYVATKNILVSTGSHILNDWILFTVIIALNGRPGA